ncbi:hypothetical protein [Paenibacillus sp. MMS18-CY102]|uniref:hypothetical protein n=1 Tax=Paenibacillus sp. MMS18-CY102 TaxID=2682849 RepID=UPI0013656484|nr:hypothetical protein [Paenibacillus sp. MMS18-CY102]MWC29635.1 hypothetical protein [Paenibacillus sp. MMS18-CY102]
MPLKSETMSNVLKILLWVLVALAAADLAFSVIYAIDQDVFFDQFYSIYGFENIISTVLYLIIAVVYLIWIYRVHMDLNRLFLRYPRTPGSALACMLVPFYSIYGVPSTYQIIGNHFRKGTECVRREGEWIRGLSIPLVLLILVTQVLNRLVSADDVSGALLLTASSVALILYAIFLILCMLVSNGLRKAEAEISRNTQAEADASSEALAEWNDAEGSTISLEKKE